MRGEVADFQRLVDNNRIDMHGEIINIGVVIAVEGFISRNLDTGIQDSRM
jgi:hypothetical protein